MSWRFGFNNTRAVFRFKLSESCRTAGAMVQLCGGAEVGGSVASSCHLAPKELQTT